MKAIRFLPGALPERIEIENTLEALQKQVGGHIEAVALGDGLCAVCNEEGLLMDLPHLGLINGVSFFGPVLLVGVDGEDFCDVPSISVLPSSYRLRSMEVDDEANPF